MRSKALPDRSVMEVTYYFRITFIFDAVICSINCSALFENLFSVSAITVIVLRVRNISSVLLRQKWCTK